GRDMIEKNTWPHADDLAPYIQRLTTQLGQIRKAQQELGLASGRDGTLAKRIFPDGDRGRFAQVAISFSRKEMSKSSDLASDFKQTSWSVNLFLASASGQATEASSKFQQNVMDASSEVEIGMLVARVTIARDWFDAGVLERTRGMHSISETK